MCQSPTGHRCHQMKRRDTKGAMPRTPSPQHVQRLAFQGRVVWVCLPLLQVDFGGLIVACTISVSTDSYPYAKPCRTTSTTQCRGIGLLRKGRGPLDVLIPRRQERGGSRREAYDLSYRHKFQASVQTFTCTSTSSQRLSPPLFSCPTPANLKAKKLGLCADVHLSTCQLRVRGDMGGEGFGLWLQ